MVEADYKQHLEIKEMQEMIKLLVARERQKTQKKNETETEA